MHPLDLGPSSGGQFRPNEALLTQNEQRRGERGKEGGREGERRGKREGERERQRERGIWGNSERGGKKERIECVENTF